MVIYRGPATRSCSTSRPGSRRRAGPRRTQHLDRLLDGLADDERGRPKLVHRLDKDTSGALLVARTARAAGHFAKAFSGRTARKVYWALVVGVPIADEGMIDAPLAKQPGTGGEKMHVDEEARASGEDPLARDRPRRQPRRLGRAPAADRPHAPAARAHGGDRPSDRRRRQIWRAGRVPDRRDQPQDAPPRAAHRIDAPDGGKIDVTAELPSISPRALRCSGSVRWRAKICRSKRPSLARSSSGGSPPLLDFGRGLWALRVTNCRPPSG